MANQVRPIPTGYHSISPALTCKGAASAIDFYKKVFGATEIARMPSPDGSIGHAELRIGDSIIFVNDPMGPVADTTASSQSIYLYLYVEDADAVYKRAVEAGARVDMPIDNMFWGDRYAKITDPYGHGWGIATRVEDVAPADMGRRAQEFFAKMAKAAGHP